MIKLLLQISSTCTASAHAVELLLVVFQGIMEKQIFVRKINILYCNNVMTKAIIVTISTLILIFDLPVIIYLLLSKLQGAINIIVFKCNLCWRADYSNGYGDKALHCSYGVGTVKSSGSMFARSFVSSFVGPPRNVRHNRSKQSDGLWFALITTAQNIRTYACQQCSFVVQFSSKS